MTVTQAKLKELLKQGLTGWEAGRLILQDSWEVDRGREGFLSEADLDRIRQSLTEPKEIRIYNSLIETYRIVGYSLKQAHILALEAQLHLKDAAGYLKDYRLDERVRSGKTLLIDRAPVIMTQKQWDDIQASHSQKKLKEDDELRAEALRERGVAILHNPQPDQVDDRGWYKEPDRSWLEDITRIRSVTKDSYSPAELTPASIQAKYERAEEPTIPEIIELQIAVARATLRQFLAFQAVIKMVGEVIGLEMTEDLEQWYTDIQRRVKEYNYYADDSQHPYLPPGFKPAILKLGKYRPDRSEVEYLKDRFELSLGEGWWQEVAKTVRQERETEQTVTNQDTGQVESREVIFGQSEKE